MNALSFAHLRSTSPRTGPPRKIVIHTSGGIRPPEGLYQTLRSRIGPRTPDGLSAHYLLGADGRTLQTAPDSLVCLHAGKANLDSIGIECVSPLFPGVAWKAEQKRGVTRARYRDRVRGRRTVDLLDLTAAQGEALALLVESLCDRHEIPRRVPLDRDGTLLRREMTLAELRDFEGVLGHFQVPTSPTVKLDPGTAPLDRLRVRWK
jgi:N-acetyl-anhydromuramyl-L-alanine amidase AmpD